MNNLSFHITDITANSIRANASEIGLHIEEQDAQIIIRITDDGFRNGRGNRCPHHKSVLHHPHDPQSGARYSLPDPECGADRRGCVHYIQAGKGNGGGSLFPFRPYRLSALGGSSGNGRYADHRQSDINVRFEYQAGKTTFSISTNEIKEILDGIPLSHPKVMLLVKEMIRENIRL